MKRLRICFVATGAYPLLMNKEPDHIIGPDVHQVILAKALIKEFDITFVTYLEGINNTECTEDGIEVIKTYPVNANINRLSKLRLLWTGLKKADADIYYHAGGLPGAVSSFCKLHHKKYIYSISSDAIVDRKIISEPNKEFNNSGFSMEAIGNRMDIKTADRLIVQTERQKQKLSANYRKQSHLIKMPLSLGSSAQPLKAKPPVVLWVGSLAEVKRPDLFIELAASIPEYNFKMIGGSLNKKLSSKMLADAHKLANFEYLGPIAFSKIVPYFRKAAILVNTSLFEGYPHSFIQAWMSYTPVASINADPDEVICRYKLGFHSKSFGNLIRDVKILLENEDLRTEMGIKARDFVEKEHDVNKIINKYKDIMKTM